MPKNSADYKRKWNLLNPDKHREQSKKWKKLHPEKQSILQRKLNLKYKWGITFMEYEVMLGAQGGACAICRKVPDGKYLAIDHDHRTGKIRGLLCSKCNTALGSLKEDPESIMRMLAYVREGQNETNSSIVDV